MLKDIINGLSMALADSVPGVSGGTIAFIMGFYDDFIGSISRLVFGDKKQKKKSFIYLSKLGIGWLMGMILAVFILTSLFEKHIYVISSLFIGFELGAIPLIVREEKIILNKKPKGLIFVFIGAILVIAITWINTKAGSYNMDFTDFSLELFIKLFIIGMLSISAMFLPGISGSTILLIFGAYIPIISNLKNILSFNFEALPAILVFVMGVIFGGISIVRLIRYSLRNYRAESIYAVLGMMIGAFYAIIMGPTSLSQSNPPLSFESFSILANLVGVFIIFTMEFFKKMSEEK